MRVAVLGAGNGGVAAAFDFAQHGHEVSLCATPEFGTNVVAVNEAGGIYASGDLEGFAPIRYSGHDHGEALEGAELVVLGACRSARGPVSSDGIAGLTRAFMTAGVPSVIATLWDVSDQATARVMTRFYRGYLAGTSKDHALRAAQLALLRDLRAGKVTRTVGETTLTYAEHPHLWAGTILIGATSR